MVISSRTLEGRQNHCEICQKGFVLEPSCVGHDATCPHCGTLAWFDASCSKAFDDPRSIWEQQAPRVRRRSQRRQSLSQHPVSLLHACWSVAQKAWSVLNQPLPIFGSTKAVKI